MVAAPLTVRVQPAGAMKRLPSAYKDIDKVMASQEDLVEIVAELKQVMCVKG